MIPMQMSPDVVGKHDLQIILNDMYGYCLFLSFLVLNNNPANL